MAPLLRALLALTLLLPYTHSTPLPTAHSPYLTKESIAPPSSWLAHARAPASHTLTLRIGLAQPGISALHEALHAVSDPSHASYGQHLSKSAVDALVAPSMASVDAVEQWLDDSGVDLRGIGRSAAGDWLTLRLPVGEAERLLQTEYFVWRHVRTGEEIVRTTSWSLPEALHAHVRVVQPTTMFARPLALRTPFVGSGGLKPLAAAVGAEKVAGAEVPDAVSCKIQITPACLETLYATTGYTASANATQLGITGYLEQYANAADLQSFYKEYAKGAVGSTFQTVLINGGENVQTASDAGTEANLDTQYGGALTYPIPNVFYSTGGSPPFDADDAETTNTNEPYLDWLDYVLGLETLPSVISTSYGDDEQTVPLSYAESVCDMFAQLGARGVSVIFASGDYGVGPSASECYSNDGKNTRMFIPNFPASCPYVTSVGATTSTGPEVASSAFASGGGFSNYFAQPSYQASAVSAYLSALGTTNSGLYNASGRAYPDVAAQGENFVIYVGGSAGRVDGTSCAAPTFSGVIALVNDALVGAGKPALGFLNPFLYGAGLAGLTDVTSGTNPGCGTQGFSAGAGWDPVTGLGTPVFTKLRSLAGA